MKAEHADSAIQPLQSLPRDKKTLDFILKKLTENSSPERHEVLGELLEMHRTSAGFNPKILSKGRFKRFRSSEIRQVLTELEQALSVITASAEYRQHLEDAARHHGLIEQYSNMVSLLTAPPTKELNDRGVLCRDARPCVPTESSVGAFLVEAGSFMIIMPCR